MTNRKLTPEETEKFVRFFRVRAKYYEAVHNLRLAQVELQGVVKGVRAETNVEIASDLIEEYLEHTNYEFY